MTEAGDRHLIERLAAALQRRGQMLVTAESCTGGGLAWRLTALPGSSHWFERGFVTYSNAAKTEELGVGEALLARHGAVSEAVAAAMAEGALAHSHADLGVGITGIAGPEGGTTDKPVGLVCFGWAGDRATRTDSRVFEGGRAAVREQSIEHAVQGLIDRLEGHQE